MKAKIIFFGSDQYSLIVLERLYQDKRFSVVAVVTLPTAEMVRKFSQKNKIPQVDAKTENLINALKNLTSDVGVLASFGKIIPGKMLAIPRRGILNIHPSLLPKYRGPAPAQAAILNGDKEIGATIIKMDEKIDHGPIVAQFREVIQPDDTAESLYKRLFTAGAEVLTTILPAYLEGRIELREQDHLKATFTKKLTRADGKIDWSQPDDYLERFIRAMSSWPGAWTLLRPRATEGQTKRLKILKAHLENGKLVLDQVQLEGKKPVTWKQFQEGYPEAKIIS